VVKYFAGNTSADSDNFANMTSVEAGQVILEMISRYCSQPSNADDCNANLVWLQDGFHATILAGNAVNICYPAGSGPATGRRLLSTNTVVDGALSGTSGSTGGYQFTDCASTVNTTGSATGATNTASTTSAAGTTTGANITGPTGAPATTGTPATTSPGAPLANGAMAALPPPPPNKAVAIGVGVGVGVGVPVLLLCCLAAFCLMRKGGDDEAKPTGKKNTGSTPTRGEAEDNSDQDQQDDEEEGRQSQSQSQEQEDEEEEEDSA